LNSSAQPVFTVATHSFSEDECARLRREFFGDVTASDLKHKSLKRRPAQQAMVVKFLELLKADASQCKIGVVHKKFGLLCKAVDWIIEPWTRRTGTDLYERGGNLATANLLHMMLVSFAPDFHEELLGVLQAFLNEPNEDAREELGGLVLSQTYLPGDSSEEHTPLANTLNYLLCALLDFRPSDMSAIRRNKTELALTTTLGLAASWRKQLGTDFAIVHDCTSNMSRQKAYWDAIVSPTAPVGFVGYDRRSLEFPIGVAETKFVPSEQSLGIQIADVIAGAATEWAAWMASHHRKKSDYVKRLEPIFHDWRFTKSIWPSSNVTPEALGTDGPKHDDVFEYWGGILTRAKGDA
jgi:hypothetical protein